MWWNFVKSGDKNVCYYSKNSAPYIKNSFRIKCVILFKILAHWKIQTRLYLDDNESNSFLDWMVKIVRKDVSRTFEDDKDFNLETEKVTTSIYMTSDRTLLAEVDFFSQIIKSCSITWIFSSVWVEFVGIEQIWIHDKDVFLLYVKQTREKISGSTAAGFTRRNINTKRLFKLAKFLYGCTTSQYIPYKDFKIHRVMKLDTLLTSAGVSDTR